MVTAEQRVVEQKIIGFDADILDLQVRMVTTEDEVRKLRMKVMRVMISLTLNLTIESVIPKYSNVKKQMRRGIVMQVSEVNMTTRTSIYTLPNPTV